uniref:RNase H type-1 domain-containing protein n=1 Tax=Leersia perrieri TaxID=77586 RepID=A0A0D9XJA3_9ORYZ
MASAPVGIVSFLKVSSLCSSLSLGENLVPIFWTDVVCIMDAIFLKTMPYFSLVVLALGSRSGSFVFGNDDLGLSFSCTATSFSFVHRRPETGWVKLNVDGSFDEATGRGGIGIILRDSEGQAICSACAFMPHCSQALEAVILVLRQGLEIGMQNSELPIIVESDCAVAIHLIQEKAFDQVQDRGNNWQ